MSVAARWCDVDAGFVWYFVARCASLCIMKGVLRLGLITSGMSTIVYISCFRSIGILIEMSSMRRFKTFFTLMTSVYKILSFVSLI